MQCAIALARRRAGRTVAVVVALTVVASVIACSRARSHGYETGDGIPAVPENAVSNATGTPGG